MSRFIWTLETIGIMFAAIGVCILLILTAEYFRQLMGDRIRRARAAKAGNPHKIKVTPAPGGFHILFGAEGFPSKRVRIVSPEGDSLTLCSPDPWHTNPRKPYAIERSFGDGWIAVIHDMHTGNTVKPLWPYEWELIDDTRFVVKEGGAATLTEAKIAAVEAFEIEEAKIKYIDERGKL